MGNRKTLLLYSVLLALLMAVSACKTTKKSVSQQVVSGIQTPKERVLMLSDSSNYPRTFSAKMQIDAELSWKDVSITAALDIIRGEGICFSIRPFLGVEAIRVIFTPEEILVVSRLENHYYKKTYTELSPTMEGKSIYSVIESIFLNRPYLGDSTSVIDSFSITETANNGVRLSRSIQGNGKYNLSINKDNLLDTVSLSFPDKGFSLLWNYFSFLKKEEYTIPFNSYVRLQKDDELYELKIAISQLHLNKNIVLNKKVPDYFQEGEWKELYSLFIK